MYRLPLYSWKAISVYNIRDEKSVVENKNNKYNYNIEKKTNMDFE